MSNFDRLHDDFDEGKDPFYDMDDHESDNEDEQDIEEYDEEE